MPNATDQQVQTYVNERVRPFDELIRKVYLLAKDDKAAIDDVYSACAQQSPTWVDNRTDGPPHLLAPSDVLAFNAWITNLIQIIENSGFANDTARANAVVAIANGWTDMLKGCVRAPNV